MISIQTNLTYMIMLKHFLPPGQQAGWTDCRLIQNFHARLRPEEQTQDTLALNINNPNQFTRTWENYSTLCNQQINIYRQRNPVAATATAAQIPLTKPNRTTCKPNGIYCFGFGCDPFY